MPTKLSHPRALTPISDPIHKRFEFNILERDIIDSEYFQRLHFVLQNSTTYVSHPSNKNTRFPHSLGVCHIAGRQFQAATRNAEPETLRAFLGHAALFLKELIQSLAPTNAGAFPGNGHEEFRSKTRRGYEKTIKGLSGFSNRPLFESRQEVVSPTEVFETQNGFDASFLADCCWQALRIYGLVHDIGHLPMSHAFEAALEHVGETMKAFGQPDNKVKDFEGLLSDRRAEFSGLSAGQDKEHYVRFFAKALGCDEDSLRRVAFSKQLHEVRGLTIFNRLVAEYRNSSEDEDVQCFANVIHHFTLCLMFSSAMKHSKTEGDPQHAFLLVLRTLVDGQIDSDRLDYTLRDGFSSGSDLGRFDLERVCGNAVLFRTGKLQRNFCIAYYVRALSGLEQFFEERYQSYKYIIYHRTSSRSNKILEYLLTQLFHFCHAYANSKIAEIVEAYGYIRRDDPNGRGLRIKSILPDAKDSIIRIDDANLRTLLFRLRNKLRDEVMDHQGDPDRIYLAEELHTLIGIVTVRDFRHVTSVLKKRDIYEFCSETLAHGDRASRLVVGRMLKEHGEYEASVRRMLREFATSRNLPPISFICEVCKPKVFDFPKQPSPWAADEVFVIREDAGYSRLSERSPLLREMAARRKTETFGRAYIVMRDIKSRDDILEEVNGLLRGFVGRIARESA